MRDQLVGVIGWPRGDGSWLILVEHVGLRRDRDRTAIDEHVVAAVRVVGVTGWAAVDGTRAAGHEGHRELAGVIRAPDPDRGTGGVGGHFDPRVFLCAFVDVAVGHLWRSFFG